MKKIVLIIFVLLLAGCNTQNTQSISDAQAQEAFEHYLNGETKAITDISFKDDDGDGNLDGLEYGEYTLSSLKQTFGSDLGEIKVAYMDFGNNGVHDMVLRFEPLNPSFLNFTVILHYDGEKLIISASYYDGYRILGELYNDGHLGIFAADGAGIYMNDYYQFSEKGKKSLLYSHTVYSAYYVQSIFNSLSKDIERDYTELLLSYGDVAFCVEEYKTNKEYKSNENIKIAVIDWDDNNQALFFIEQQLINDLKAAGAEVITTEEMVKISDASDIKNSGLKEFETIYSIKTDYVEPNEEPVNIYGIYREDDIYHLGPHIIQSYDVYLGDGAHNDSVVIYGDKPLKNIRAHVIEYDSFDHEGSPRIVVTDQWAAYEEISEQYPLILHTDLEEDPIKIAFSYVKEDGQREYLQMSLVGEEKDLYLTPFVPFQIYE